MDDMKESGIPWLGEIPAEWDSCRIKYVAKIIRGGSPRPIEKFMSDSELGYNWIKIGDTDKDSRYILHISSKIIPEGLSKTRLVKPGTLLLTNSMSFGEPYILNVEGCIHDGWVAFFDYQNIDKIFLYYCLKSSSCRKQFEIFSDGGVVQNLNIDKIGKTVIAVPSINEQQRIADFLDEKCGEIDGIVTKIQQEIETLKQYKQSVISEAVTKGIRPNVPMKDSGISWIGKVPDTWKIQNPKRFFKQRKDKASSGMVQYTASQKYGIITQQEYEQLTGAHIVTVQKGFDILKLVCKGDFVIHMRSFQGGLEYSRVTGAISSAYVMLIPDKKYICAEYFKWFFKFPAYIGALRSTSNLIRDGQAMRFNNFIQISVIIPPLEEQREIAAYLDQKCATIDGIISSKEEQLQTLGAYKKSLIYEYVTGKKRVPTA